MITFKLSDGAVIDQKAQCLVFTVEQGFTFSKALQSIADEIFPNLQDLFKQHKFTGALLSTVTLSATINKKLVQCIFVGIGKADDSKNPGRPTLRRNPGGQIDSNGNDQAPPADQGDRPTLKRRDDS